MRASKCAVWLVHDQTLGRLSHANAARGMGRNRAVTAGVTAGQVMMHNRLLGISTCTCIDF